MEALQIMPAMAQRRNSNLGEFAEDATVVVEEITKPRKVNHFIEANSVEVSLEHMEDLKAILTVGAILVVPFIAAPKAMFAIVLYIIIYMAFRWRNF